MWLNRRMSKLWFAFIVCLIAACSQHNDGPADMAMPPDMTKLLSSCGHPGDKGNSLGVGKFCTKISDCFGDAVQTNICSSLGNGPDPSQDDTYFCTIYPCHLATDGGAASSCGENATCVCGSGGGMTGCACTPNSCLGTPPDAGAVDSR